MNSRFSEIVNNGITTPALVKAEAYSVMVRDSPDLAQFARSVVGGHSA